MPDTRPWYFYILRCCDGRLYTGIAVSLQERIREHNAGKGADFTARRRPVTLVYHERHPTYKSARQREMQVKAWRANKKRQLIAGFPSAASG